jgi:predicted nucleotidyltransferase
MSLFKLSRLSQIEFDPQEKSTGIIRSFECANLIQTAYLFGSGAIGTMTPDSDLDLLLVFANDVDLNTAKTEIIHARQDIAIDWIFKTAADFEKEKDFGGVTYDAFHFGKKIK